MIIYLHGLNSSALSGKCVLLGEYCGARGVPFASPTLSPQPAKAVAQVRELIDDGGHHTLVGSSMGGYYATYLCEQYPQTRAVLINPALKLADKLASLVGETQHNYHNGTQYVFQASYIDELREMEVGKLSDPTRYWLMVQTGDEVLPYEEATHYYDGAKQTVVPGGDHSFVGFADYLADIVAFAQAGGRHGI